MILVHVGGHGLGHLQGQDLGQGPIVVVAPDLVPAPNPALAPNPVQALVRNLDHVHVLILILDQEVRDTGPVHVQGAVHILDLNLELQINVRASQSQNLDLDHLPMEKRDLNLDQNPAPAPNHRQ